MIKVSSFRLLDHPSPVSVAKIFVFEAFLDFLKAFVHICSISFRQRLRYFFDQTFSKPLSVPLREFRTMGKGLI